MTRPVSPEAFVKVSGEARTRQYREMLDSVAVLLQIVDDPGRSTDDRSFVIDWETCASKAETCPGLARPDMLACGRVSSPSL